MPTSGTTKPRNRFVPPTAEEVRAYCKEIGFELDAEKFCDYYAAKGWVVGKSPMKDWKAAVRNWRSSERSTPVQMAIPGNYDHLPLGFTQAEKDKMARVARERAEDGLQ